MNKKHSIEVTGKSIEDAVKKGLKKLNRKIEDIDIEVLDESKGGFFSFGSNKAKVRLTVINPEEDVEETAEEDNEEKVSQEEILSTFDRIIHHMGFDVNPEIADMDNKYRIIIKETEDASLLIGKNGKTIDAMQLIMNKIFSKRKLDKPIYIDIKGYVIQKQKNKRAGNWKSKKRSSHK